METKVRKIGSVFASVVVLALLLAACGPSAITVTLTGGHDIDGGVKDFMLTLSAPSAKPGEITFHIQNDSETEVHEFVVIKTDLGAGSLPKDPYSTVAEAQLTVIDEVEDLKPGKSADLTVTLEAGHYALICNLPGHYINGMFTDFTVTP